MEGASLVYYGGLPATVDGDLPATVDGDSKSPSTSGLGAAKSEHLSLQPLPQFEEFSDVAVELASQATTDANYFTSSYSNNYEQDGSSDRNSESHPPQPLEALSTERELSSPRNSAATLSASVSLSVPVISESHHGQEQVLMAAVPKVLTMPSACSDATTNVFMANNTGNTITSHQTLQNSSVEEEQTPAGHEPSHPLLSDDRCQQCHCDKMAVTLLPCCYPMLCRGCAEDILEDEKKCPNCKQPVTDSRVI